MYASSQCGRCGVKTNLKGKIIRGLLGCHLIHVSQHHHTLAEEGNEIDERLLIQLSNCKNSSQRKKTFDDSSFLSPTQIEIYSELGSLTTFIPDKLIESFYDIPLNDLNEFTQTTLQSTYPTMKDFFGKVNYKNNIDNVIINSIEINQCNLIEWGKRIVERMKKINNFHDKWKFILITPTIEDIKIDKNGNNSNIVPTLYETLHFIKRELPKRTYIVVLKNEKMNLWKEYRKSFNYCQSTTDTWFNNNDKFNNNTNNVKCDLETWEYLQMNITRYFNNKFFNINIINLLENFIPISVFTNEKTLKTDLSILSIDCKHLSARGISILHTTLWNYLISPSINNYESKSYFKPILQELKCPVPSCPFLYTTDNIIYCDNDYFNENYFLTHLNFVTEIGQEAIIVILLVTAIILYSLIWGFLVKVLHKKDCEEKDDTEESLVTNDNE
uniref:SGNH domain-containing protein n=1 Tax=Parastrongyloides trichosuri TaxID=131310 RepID=A0A0N5A5E4_PARTI